MDRGWVSRIEVLIRQLQGGSAHVPHARVYNSGNVSIPSGTPTAIPYDTVAYDQGGADDHFSASTSTRLTCRSAGLYAIVGFFLFDSTGGGDRSGLISVNNAVTIVHGGPIGFTYVGAIGQRIGMATHYRLEEGDYVQMLASQASGSARNVQASGEASPTLMFAKLSG